MFYPFSSGQEDIVKDGLVLWLDAGDRSSYPGGSNVWRDLTPNANNGTLFNTPTFSSANGGSIVFDGSDDYGRLTSKIFQGINDFTFSCILKNTQSTYTNYGGPIYTEWSSGSGTSNTVYVSMGEGNTQISSSPFRINFWFQVANTQYQNSSNTTIPVNQTVSLTCVREGDQSKIYINESLDSTVTAVSGPLDTRSNDPLIAKAGYGAVFKGNIYTIQIYNRALSANEISQNFNATRTRFGV
jgi:hypothetical protein